MLKHYLKSDLGGTPEKTVDFNRPFFVVVREPKLKSKIYFGVVTDPTIIPQ